jgi:hypothetical protein
MNAHRKPTAGEYARPTISDYGTLTEITAACDAPGVGDQNFPNIEHTKLVVNSQGFTLCSSQ